MVDTDVNNELNMEVRYSDEKWSQGLSHSTLECVSVWSDTADGVPRVHSPRSDGSRSSLSVHGNTL